MDWLDSFLEELKDCLVEHGFASRWELIEGYHEIGRLIAEQKNNLDKYYGQNVVKKVSDYIGKSERTVRYAVSFYEKWPDLDLLPDGKNVSWNKIIKRLEGRPEKEEKRAKIMKCPECGHEWEI